MDKHVDICSIISYYIMLYDPISHHTIVYKCIVLASIRLYHYHYYYYY